MARSVLLDTGPLVAALDARDPWHSWAIDVLARERAVAATVWPVVTEAAWLCGSRGGVRSLFEMLTESEVRVVAMGSSDFGSLAYLMEQYADLPMDLADASLVHIYARESFDAVMTVDRRDFSIYRVGGKPLRLIAPDRDHPRG